jgi:hypothetical protein
MAADGCRAAALVYPHFATSLVSLVVSGAVIGFLLWCATRLGLVSWQMVGFTFIDPIERREVIQENVGCCLVLCHL